jgi:hypothetical protein
MKKSTKQNLDKLAQWAPTIDEAALRGYVGGGTSDSSYYYGAATENPYGYFTVDPYGSYGATENPYYGYGSSTESPGYVEDYSIYCTSTPTSGDTTQDPCIFEKYEAAEAATINFLAKYYGSGANVTPTSEDKKSKTYYQTGFRVEYDTPLGHHVVEYVYDYSDEGSSGWVGNLNRSLSHPVPPGFPDNVPCEDDDSGTTTCEP